MTVTSSDNDLSYQQSINELRSNFDNIKEFSFVANDGNEYVVRPMTLTDSARIVSLYKDVYSDEEHSDSSLFDESRYRLNYWETRRFIEGDTQFYCLNFEKTPSPEYWVVRSQTALDTFDNRTKDPEFWFVVEEKNKERWNREIAYILCISTHLDDLSGELCRAATKKEYQNNHIGTNAVRIVDEIGEQLGLEKLYGDAVSYASFKYLLSNGYAPEGMYVGEYVEHSSDGPHRRISSTRMARLTKKGLESLETDISPFQFDQIVLNAMHEENVRKSYDLDPSGMYEQVVKQIASKNPEVIEEAMSKNKMTRSYMESLEAREE